MNNLVSKNPVLRFKEGRKVVKAKGGIWDKIWSTITDTDRAYIDNPAVMTAAGHTAKVSLIHEPTAEERLLGENLYEIGKAGAMGMAGNALATIKWAPSGQGTFLGVLKSLPGRVTTPNVPALATANYPATVSNGLTTGLKVWRAIGGTTLLGFPLITSVISNDSSIKTAGINNGLSTLTKASSTKKEFIPLGQVSATRDKYIKNKGNTQYTEIIPGVNDIDTQMKINSLPSRKGVQKVSTPQSVFAGYRIGRTGGLNYNINDADKQQLIGTGQFTESDFTNALATQLALNRYFANSGLGSIKEDNAWGDQSRKALEFALSKSKGLTPFNNETTVVKTPIVPTYTPSTTPISLEVANLKLNVNVPQLTYDRTGIREYLRSKGLNPYSFSGALRRALRMIMNGQGTDNDKLLVKEMNIFKQGGNILLSRNPVIRFRNRNFK